MVEDLPDFFMIVPLQLPLIIAQLHIALQRAAGTSLPSLALCLHQLSRPHGGFMGSPGSTFQTLG